MSVANEVLSDSVAEFPWGGVSILIVLAILFGGLARLGAQPLQLELYGDLQRSEAGAITAELRPALQAGFFAASSAEVRAQLAEVPWVEAAQTEFLWPDRLALHITEHTPLAAIEGGGVITKAGTIIDVPAPGGLPIVRGTQHRTQDIAEVLRLVQEACADCAVRGLEIRGGQQLRLQLTWADHALRVELGRPDWRDAMARLTNHALPALREQLARVETIDMRYRHAYAVRWNEEGIMGKTS